MAREKNKMTTDERARRQANIVDMVNALLDNDFRSVVVDYVQHGGPDDIESFYATIHMPDSDISGDRLKKLMKIVESEGGTLSLHSKRARNEIGPIMIWPDTD
jgi:hypothetical protein